ncbi:MAG: hypothetical protein P8H59_00500 [Flavobacteriales bacterium]|nr:hypothetical protein [Flavobacteriales bacterium]MDG1779402.1 hypothetical protein [Flavobacteriales bacterium]MDG2245224.1 hypothetical protein [Flavobacteriales bacterium]
MRVIAEIPHQVMKITIFAWNEKYHIKYEVGQFEQTFKIGQTDVTGVDDLKKMSTPEFETKVLKRFVEMRSDFAEAWKTI